jgi:hypothetical protein
MKKVKIKDGQSKQYIAPKQLEINTKSKITENKTNK